VVKIVGTLKTFAAFASPMTLFDDHHRLMAVQVGELEGLVIDQNEHRFLRVEKARWGRS
jgi:hypothetical protein